MRVLSILLKGAIAGAACMYLFDPDRGRGRRARARDRLLHYGRVVERELRRAARDLGQRARGQAIELRHALEPAEASDVVLAERVRARLGRLLSHPRALAIEVHDGAVVLSGPLPRYELDAVLRRVTLTPGVHRVENRLEVHDDPSVVPALRQSGRVHRHDGIPPAWRDVGLLVGAALLARRLVAPWPLALAALLGQPRRGALVN